MSGTHLPLFTIVPNGKEKTELAGLVHSEEVFGTVQLRNEFCDRAEQSLLQLHLAYLELLKTQPAVSSSQSGVIPPHTQIAIEAHSQSLILKGELLLQQIHELKVHIITCLATENSKNGSNNSGNNMIKTTIGQNT